MRATVTAALDRLRERRSDAESGSERRRGELRDAEEGLGRHEEELREKGARFDYYQELRVACADWVGALRSLAERVGTISEAVADLEAEAAERGRERLRQAEDGYAEVLRRNGLLDGVIGRDPSPSLDAVGKGPSVDEFGREIQPMKALERDRRMAARRQKLSERRENHQGRTESQASGPFSIFEDTDVEMSPNELDQQTTRLGALEQALHLAKMQMEDKYCSFQALVDLFATWKKMNLADYERCFADLSLAEMASVLVQADLCMQSSLTACSLSRKTELDFEWARIARDFDRIGMEKQEKDEYALNNSRSRNEGAAKQTLVQMIAKKTILPRLSALVDGDKGVYLPHSSHQTGTICALVRFLNDSHHRPEGAAENHRTETKQIVECIRQHQNTMSILLVGVSTTNLITVDEKEEDDSDLRDAVFYAVVEQTYRVKKLIMNAVAISFVLASPTSRNDAAVLVLRDMIGIRLLPLLSLWRGMGGLWEGRARLLLREIWDAIQRTDWLDSEHLLVQSAPLRAAIANFGID